MANFDPYANMPKAVKDRLKRSLREPRELPQHSVKNGEIYRAGMTDPVPVNVVKKGQARHARRVAELDRQIATLQQERQAHLDQAQHLEAVLNQVED